MKKALILGFLLVFALSMVLVACGEAEETTTTAAPVETTTTAGAATQEPVTFKLASTFNENETGGKIVQHFADYITEKTNGAVTIEVYPGGTLGGPPELLDLVTTGSADIVPLGHPPFADKLPLLNFPMWAPGDPQAAIDYFNTLVFDDPATSALIQKEAENLGIKYLGFTAGGANAFISKTPFETLDDLVGKKFGAGGSIPAFEALGYTVIQAFPPDMYENLSRGVADATQMGFAPTVALKWYEPAPYYKFDGTYAAGNPWTVNLESWAKLSPETQQIFMDAAKDAEAYSLELDKTDTEAGVKTITDAGGTVGTLSADDQAKWWKNLFDASAADCMARAEKLGITEDMITVLSKAAEITNTTWAPPAS
jgi:TRAP-type C4-dicarboxylate transport system substrate-binding protein